MSIPVVDVIEWMNTKAIGRSTTVPSGWINGEDLKDLADTVLKLEPLNCYLFDLPTRTTSLPKG